MDTSDRQPLLSEGPAALAARLGGSGRARAVYRLLRAGEDPLEHLEGGPLARLSAAAGPLAAVIERREVAADGTTKLLLRLEDARGVEAVLIPAEARTTLCVSSQVGCGRGCEFCLTATMGLVRNLSSAEILAQVVRAVGEARRRALPPVRNLVFMGMGEPLDNPDAVRGALEILAARDGLAFAPRHLTVSTVGTSPRAIREAASWPGELAWSLHAADEALRRRLVPTAKVPVRALAEAFFEALAQRVLFVEVVLIAGVNDRDADAEAIVALFEAYRGEARFNLLPMNPIGRPELAPSTRAEPFAAILRAAGHFTMARRARGGEERAACGQLAVLGG